MQSSRGPAHNNSACCYALARRSPFLRFSGIRTNLKSTNLAPLPFALDQPEGRRSFHTAVLVGQRGTEGSKEGIAPGVGCSPPAPKPVRWRAFRLAGRSAVCLRQHGPCRRLPVFTMSLVCGSGLAAPAGV